DPIVSSNLFGSPPEKLSDHLKWIKSQKNIRIIYIILFENKPVGYCQIYNITDEKIEVGWAINSLFHNQGIGRFAVKELISKCKIFHPNKRIELYVKSSNIPAIKIYELNGFKISENTLTGDTIITKMILKNE